MLAKESDGENEAEERDIESDSNDEQRNTCALNKANYVGLGDGSSRSNHPVLAQRLGEQRDEAVQAIIDVLVFHWRRSLHV